MLWTPQNARARRIRRSKFVEWLDGASHYTTVAQMDGKWNDTGVGTSITSATGSHGQNEISLGGGGIFVTLSYQSRMTMHWRERFVMGGGWGSAEPIFRMHSNGTILATLWVESDGTLTLWAGDRATLVGNTGVSGWGALHPNTYYHFIVDATFSGSSPILANLALYMNGNILTPVLSGVSKSTGVNTSSLYGGAAVNRYDWLNPNISGNGRVSDIVAINGDDGGTGRFTGPLGDLKIGTRYMMSVTHSGMWSAHGGTLQSAISEHSPDEDTSYDDSDTNDDLLDGPFDPIPAFSGILVAQQLLARVRKDDEGTRHYELTVAGGGGDDIYPGDNYSYGRRCMDQDPRTNMQWVVADANSADYGMRGFNP